MNFRYTDLGKFENYIGYESGVWCVYPNYLGINLLKNNATGEGAFGCNNASPT
jgi:hypothetical protein